MHAVEISISDERVCKWRKRMGMFCVRKEATMLKKRYCERKSIEDPNLKALSIFSWLPTISRKLPVVDDTEAKARRDPVWVIH